MDPVKIIKQDHRTVKSLFRRYERADRRADKQKIAEEIIEELSVHATIEEQLVYPVLREAEKRLERPVLNALEEHHAAKLVLAELDKMKVDDERFDAKMHVVRESIEMHIEEEESTLLPRLERLLNDDVRATLAEAMIAAKRSAPNHPHPGAPDTPPAGMIAGLVAKVMDAGKDMVRKVTSSDQAAGHRRVKRRAAATAANLARRSGRRSKTAARGTAQGRPTRRAGRTRPQSSTRRSK
jgi:hemerythrin superfamily protein